MNEPPVTHARLAAQLLRDAAAFFRRLGEQNPPLAEQMSDNASIFEDIARLVEIDPLGEVKE